VAPNVLTLPLACIVASGGEDSTIGHSFCGGQGLLNSHRGADTATFACSYSLTELPVALQCMSHVGIYLLLVNIVAAKSPYPAWPRRR